MKRIIELLIFVLAIASASFLAGYFFGGGGQAKNTDVPAFTVHAVEPEESPQASAAMTEIYLTRDININTASAEELEALPGIGPKLAQRIVAYREEHGYFTIIEDLTLVEGIGSETMDRIRSRVTIE